MKVKIEVIIPEKLVLEMEANMVTIPGIEGEFGVMHEHVNFVTMIHPGLLKMYDENQEIIKEIFIADGFVEVNQDSVRVIVKYVHDVEEFDEVVINETLNKCKNDLLSDQCNLDSSYLKKQIEIYEVMLEIISTRKKY